MKLAVFGEIGQLAMALSRHASEDLIIETIGREAVEFTNPASVAEATRALSADVIVNAVAYTAVDAAEGEPDVARLVNGISVGEMARVAAERGIPLIHVSTDYVFDGTGTAARAPDEPTSPLNVYGATKLEGEQAVIAAGGRYAILRTSWVFSEDGGNFVKTMLRLSETRDALDIVADQIGGPTSADAIAKAVIRVAEALARGAEGGIYHITGAPDVSWADFAREIFRQAGREVTVNDIPTTAYPTPAKRPLNSRLDCESLTRDFGITRPDWRLDLARVLKELT